MRWHSARKKTMGEKVDESQKGMHTLVTGMEVEEEEAAINKGLASSQCASPRLTPPTNQLRRGHRPSALGHSGSAARRCSPVQVTTMLKTRGLLGSQLAHTTNATMLPKVHVIFSLREVALTYYQNHEATIKTKSHFKTDFTRDFDRPAIRKCRAEQRLCARAPQSGENFTSHMKTSWIFAAASSQSRPVLKRSCVF